jgi:hypothetical protein
MVRNRGQLSQFSILSLTTLLILASLSQYSSTVFAEKKSSDSDSDGVDDELDDCPFLAGNSTQPPNIGCPDRDNDGYSDIDDSHPDDGGQHIDSDGDGYGDNSSAQNGDAFPNDASQWRDSDGDGYGDNLSGNNSDDFIDNPSQWNDTDGDGYGDNSNGTNPDNCPSIMGNSTNDQLGCLDTDGDGWSDENDAFVDEWSQWNDSDGDGYGDNWANPIWNSSRLSHWPGVFLPGADLPDQSPLDYDDDRYEDAVLDASNSPFDDCPSIKGTSDADRFGCSDVDGDGWSDENDDFPILSSQWNDTDDDGYGDNQSGFQPDGCPTIEGGSNHDRLGCIDSDGDGWSDPTDPLTNYPWNESQGADLFPADKTRWNRSHVIVETIGNSDSQSSEGGIAIGMGMGSLITLLVGVFFAYMIWRSKEDYDYDYESYEIEHDEELIEQEDTSLDVNSNEEKERTDEDEIKETPDIHDAQKLLTAKEAILPINVDEDKEKVVEEKAGTKIDDALAALSDDSQTNVDEPLEEESVSKDDNEELDNGNNKGGKLTLSEVVDMEENESANDLQLSQNLAGISEAHWTLVPPPTELDTLCSLDPSVSKNIETYWDYENEQWDMDEILEDLSIVEQDANNQNEK